MPLPPKTGDDNPNYVGSDNTLDLEVDEFFRRNGFYPSMRLICDTLAKARFPHAPVKPAKNQGYCSYTVAIADSYILQFRPDKFKLDMRVCHQAKVLHPSLAPATAYLGSFVGSDIGELCASEKAPARLHLFIQKKTPGISLSEFRSSQGSSEAALTKDRAQRRRLVDDLADVVATSYRHRQYPCKANNQVFYKSRVGRSLRHQLELTRAIPSPCVRRHVDAMLGLLDAIELDAPWCLTHGDLIPSNIMVDPDTGRLTGLVDWAEGEWLPFGVGLYGLEEVMGEEQNGVFRFYPEHEELRMLFWRRFLEKTDASLPTLLSNVWWRRLELCRQLGILLWRGIAFDGGRLDRAVDMEKDRLEFQKLELFLQTPGPLGDTSSRTRWLLVVQSRLRARGLRNCCLGTSRSSYLDRDDEEGFSAIAEGRLGK